MSAIRHLPQARLQSLLAIPDLTQDPRHAIAQVVELACAALSIYPPLTRVQGERIIAAAHNYALLGYPEDALVQASTYTHWVDDDQLLRTQTTSLILEALIDLAPSPRACTLVAPGMVYRRDVRDPWHCGQPHQMDVWVLMPKAQESPDALRALVDTLASAIIPGAPLSIVPAEHPYTQGGIEISAQWQGRLLEIGEAGLIDPGLLARLGIDPAVWGGLALGVGLDRLAMVRKDLPDIRLLRDPLPKVASQMGNLRPWKPVSRQPVAAREVSLLRAPGESEEALVEAVLEAAEEGQALLQSVEVMGRWPESELIPAARARLGTAPGQENLLLRLTWQAEGESLARATANALTRQVYRAVHQGTAWEYCP